MPLFKKEVFFYIFFAVFVIESVFFIYFFKIDFYRYFLAAINPDFLWEMTNEDREELGLGSLEKNSLLEKAAFLKAQHMAANSYFAHTSPDGVNPWYWFREAGYDFSHAGENLAVNFSDSAKLHQAWLNSPGHRANIMNNNFTHIGIATAKGQYKGREAVFVVQLFGKLREEKVVLAEPEKPKEIELPLPAENIPSEVNAEFLGENLSLEEKEDYESFVAVVQDQDDEISPVISSSLTEREEMKYTPFLGKIALLFNGVLAYWLLFLAAVVITALALKAILGQKIKLREALVNGTLIPLMVLLSLFVNSLLARIINVELLFL